MKMPSSWPKLKRHTAVVFWHPITRVALCMLVIVLNFFFLAEDPIARSPDNTDIYIVGQAAGFIIGPYSSDVWGLMTLRVFMWLACVIGGLLMGKFLIHNWLLRDKLELEMFGFDAQELWSNPDNPVDHKGQKDKGSWMVMLFTTILLLLLGANVFNLLVFIAYHDRYDELAFSTEVPLGNDTFLKLAGGGTIVGNWLTFIMVVDGMLMSMKKQLSSLYLWQQTATLLLARVHLAHVSPQAGLPQVVPITGDLNEIENRFTPATLRNFRRMFGLFDKNGDGQIDASEALKLLEALLPGVAEETLQEQFAALDLNQKGLLGWPEFLGLMSAQSNEEQQFRAAFNLLDPHKTGTITLTGLGQYVMQTLPGGESLTVFEIQAILREVDVNGDGVIDFDDFTTSVQAVLPRDLKTKAEVVQQAETNRELAEAAKPSADRQAISMKFRRNYTRFCPALALRWRGWFRAFGLIVPSVIFILFTVIAVFSGWVTSYVGFTNELGRIMMASCRLMGDLVIVTQDWEFPTFTRPYRPGQIEAPVISVGAVKVTGKWFNYSLVFALFILDFNMIKKQFMYAPELFGQVTLQGTDEICAATAEGLPDRLKCFGCRYINAPLILKLLALWPMVVGLFIPLYVGWLYRRGQSTSATKVNEGFIDRLMRKVDKAQTQSLLETAESPVGEGIAVVTLQDLQVQNTSLTAEHGDSDPQATHLDFVSVSITHESQASKSG
mmetsp:Transcript_42106/g.75388  ORF Transcript_42106/g.75388 Transcript_42106/m.75388 type:complete len:723 (-) Transcript_42106:1049-3217(-)